MQACAGLGWLELAGLAWAGIRWYGLLWAGLSWLVLALAGLGWAPGPSSRAELHAFILEGLMNSNAVRFVEAPG